MKKFNQKFSFCILKTFTGKILVTFLIICCSQQMLAQVSEIFSDGDFTANPAWSGNNDHFIVLDSTLRLNAPAEAATSYLTTTSLAIDQAEWVCDVRLEFNPSSSNFFRLYLSADTADLLQPLHGYYVLLGGAADEISLFKQSGTTSIKIIDGADGLLNVSLVNVRIKVTRDDYANWVLSYDLSRSNNYIEVGRVKDDEYASSKYVGIYCRYTATRSNSFSFDNIIVHGFPYVETPSATYKDIIITEIFPDPSPQNELPEAEFIEIYNRSDKTISLNDLSLSDGSTTGSLPAEKISPREYIILTSSTHQQELMPFGRTIAIPSFPSINNDDETLSLLVNADNLIDRVQFSSDWYRDRTKAEGGWSVELIDIDNICAEENNWSASENSKGGTPGQINSIAGNKPDNTPPNLLSCLPIDSVLVVRFNERLHQELPSDNSFSITPSIPVMNVSFLDDGHRVLKVQLEAQLQSNTIYKLHIKDVRDCSGNLLDLVRADIAVPELADSTDVVINEVLFNPSPLGVDFVEVVNRSEKYINIRNWSLCKRVHGGIEKHLITANDILLKPKEYMLFTTDASLVRSEYTRATEETFFTIQTMPSMNDEEGNISIRDHRDTTIDEFDYHRDMHSPFVKNAEGVSLERIATIASTQDPSNWKSASEVAGFATPGYQNSMSVEGSINANVIHVEPAIFKPVSGMPDYTLIHYNFAQGGFMGNVKIIDSFGRAVRTLANNSTLASTGFIRWDGDRDDGTKARVGNYLIHFEVFDASGVATTYLQRVAIAY